VALVLGFAAAALRVILVALIDQRNKVRAQSLRVGVRVRVR
tara:strand:+ start:320 stop:442 length:123 start_codon:yes stop_codon:yes gene_type:complete